MRPRFYPTARTFARSRLLLLDSREMAGLILTDFLFEGDKR